MSTEIDDGTSPFVRTDFSNDAGWDALMTALETPKDAEFQPYFTMRTDARFNQASEEDIAKAFPNSAVIFVADQRALDTHEVLCVDESREEDSFRARPDNLWIVQNNVSTGNILFEELLEMVDEDGVFDGSDMMT